MMRCPARMLPLDRSLYIGCDGGLLRLSPGPGDSHQRETLADFATDALQLDPGGRLIAATAAGPRRSDDHGRHWHDHPGEAPRPGPVPTTELRAPARCSAVDPADPRRIAVGLDDGSVWLSVDAGVSFQALVEGLTGRVTALAFAARPTAPPPVPSASPPRVAVGQIHEVTIADEISRPVIGPHGVCKLGEADMRLPNARKGERYRVRVLALAVNEWTGRVEATVQKLAGPLP